MKNHLIERFISAAGPLLKILPAWVEAIGAYVFISEVIDSNPILKKKLGELEGKVFEFEATDIAKGFYMFIEDKGVRMSPHFAGNPDVIMRGDISVLFNLFLGSVDPDTVFFSRQLEIEGDTAAAVHLKNILAGV